MLSRWSGCLLFPICVVLWSFTASAQQDSQQRFAEAVRLQQSGDLDKAIEEYRELLKSFPNHVAAVSNLGAAYSRKGDYGHAIEQYLRALEIDENPAIRFNLALAYYNSAQAGKATTELARVLSAQPDNYRAALLLADCYLRSGENKKVIKLLSTFEKTHDDDRAFLYLMGTALIRDDQLGKGQALVDRVLRNGDSAEARLMLATAQFAARDLKAAASELEHAIRLNPNLPGANALYGRVQLASGNTDAGLEAFQRELNIDPTDYDSNLYMAVLLRKDQKNDEALPYLRRALQARPSAFDARYQLGSILLAKGDLPQAQEILEQLVKDAPSFTEAHVSLATLYFRLKRKEDGERERAIVRELGEKAQARNSGDQQKTAPAVAATGASGPSFEEIAKKAETARESDETDEAIALYSDGVRLNPQWTEGWWYLGTLLYEGSRWADARNAFQKLTNVKPSAGIAWAMLGLCDYQLRDYDRSFEHLQRGRSLGLAANTQLTMVTQFHIALLLNRGGDHDSALQLLYILCRRQEKTPALVQALGIAGLALPYLPAEVPAAQEELIREEGEAHYLAGARKLDEAVKAIEALIARHPNTPNLHYTYGVFLLLSDSSRAIEEFRREIDISPAHLPARLQIAFEYIKRGEYDQAIPLAEQAVKLSPHSFAARNAYGRALLDTGHPKEAITHLEEGLRIAPDSPETWYALVRAYTRAGRKDDAERARAEFQRLEKLKQIKQGHAPADQS